jgi:thiamine biosynthesis lipoprotein
VKTGRVALGLAAALGVAWLALGDEPTHRERVFLFGTFAEVEIRGADRRRAAAAMAEVARTWQRFHHEWHPWEPGPLSALNASLKKGEPSAPLPASLLELIALGARYERESKGLFNPAIGRLVSLWGFHGGDYPVRALPPSAAEVEAILASAPSLAQIEVLGDRARSDNRWLQLDFSAIAEGRALQEAETLLRRHGIEHALVSMGGDVLAIGRAGRRPWRIAIAHPDGGVLASVSLRDGEALFTAGGYRRYREADGERMPHLIDPRSGHPARGAVAATVLHADPVRADAAATALAVGGAAALAGIVRDMQVPCALTLEPDGSLHVTRPLHDRLTALAEAAPVRLIEIAGDCGGAPSARE